MIQSFIHTSENNNSYIYDDQHRLSLLVHPAFKKAYEKSNDIDQYYLKKKEYLREHGFFVNSELPNFGSIDKSIVNESIIQTAQILFEVTDSCNLNCTYCAFGELYEGFDAREHKNINTHNAVKLLKYIFHLKYSNTINKCSISFYGGEPLLNVNFIKQIVETVNRLMSEKEMTMDVDYSMTTNATLIYRHIDFLIANKFRLLISLDGNEENHSYRVLGENNKNSFQKVIENMDMIQRNYPDYFESNVNFNAVLHNRNSVKDIYDFIYTRYHKIPRIAELSLEDINPDKKNMLDKMFHGMRKSESEYQKEESNHLLHSELLVYKELTNFLKFFSINFYISNITSLLHNEERGLPTNTCLPFQKKYF